MRLTKTLLAAAALVTGTAATSQAYDLAGWNYTQPNRTWGYSTGDSFSNVEWLALDSRLVNAGVYRRAYGEFSWDWNEYNGGGSAYALGNLGTSAVQDGTFDVGPFDQQAGFYFSGYYLFNSGSNLGESTNIALGQVNVGVYQRLDGTYYGNYASGEIIVYERTVQVARTGAGNYGADAFSAFESDNSAVLSGSFYNSDIVGRNVLGVATSGATDLAGSVIRVGDIALGFGSAEGLFAKDGGWLDLRGDLTLGASGTIYIRDAEITSNVYTQYYTPGTLETLGVLAIESGILSVRSHFAQDMVAEYDQTLGFRDGAVNNARLFLTGYGYGFDGEGWGDASNGGGALRAITGSNIQNGNVSIIGDGEGFIDGAIIGTDAGASLTLNGAINGLNSFDSNGGAEVGFNSPGTTTVNGRILGGITNVYKAGAGELTLAAANLFSGDVEVLGGSLRVTNSGALSGTSGQTYVSSGASLVLDHATGLSLVDDLHIIGTGQAGVGGALHNKSGANATTGNLWIDSVGGGDASATVTVAASSSLTVANLRTNGDYDRFTVDVSGSGLTAGSFVVSGDTGAIDVIYKEGTGNATLTALAGALNDIDVNGGNLLVLGSLDSSASNIYDQLDIDGLVDGEGKPLGFLEIRGTHHYGEFNIGNVDALITGSITHHYDFDEDDLDINGGSTTTVDAGAFLITRGNSDSADIEDNAKLVIKGTFNALDSSFIDLDDFGTLDIRAGGIVNSRIVANDNSSVLIAAADGEGAGAGVLNGNVDAYDDATFTVSGTLNGNIITRERIDPAEGGIYSNVAITVGGTVNGNIVLRGDVVTDAEPNPDFGLPGEDAFIYSFSLDEDGNKIPVSSPGSFSTLTILAGGTVNGDVETHEYAKLTLAAGAVHNGDYIAYGNSIITINGTIDNNEGNPLGQNFTLNGSATLNGSGTIGGNLSQTGALSTVAPGNSTDVLTVLGNYSISAGTLQIELGGTDGPGNDPDGNDQLAVGGTITVSGSAVLEFKDYNAYEPTRADNRLVANSPSVGPGFQILATSGGLSRATIGTFDTVDLTGFSSRILFDHSTGKAYGTGLDLATRETFADYGDNGNRREIGRALWMESIARDNSAFADRNFESQGTQDSDLDLPVTDPDTESLGLKAFILTRDSSLVDATQVGTDLGAAAVSVLVAEDVGAALDALSPEAYVGFTELSTRLNRNFSLLGATGRRSGDETKWGFNLGYSGEQVESDGTSGYNRFKAGTNTTYLTADLALSARAHLNLSLGVDDGSVRANGFDGDADSVLGGIGLSLTPESNFARFDLGAAFSTSDLRAVRQGGVMDVDDQDAYAVSLRVTFLPKDPPLKPVVAGKAPEAPSLSWIPYVGLSYGSSSLDSFVESESEGSVQLGVDGYDRKSLIGEVGLGIEYALGAKTTLTGVLAYEHEFDSSGETDLNARFAEDGVTDTDFAIRSEGIGAGLFRVGVGIRQKVGAAASVGLSYDALMGSGLDSGHHFKADVSFRF